VLLIFVFILAIILRLNYDIFANGFNFDEIAMVSVAKQDFPFGLIKTISDIDYHAPLYYFIAHPFTYLENEWIYLRLLNLIFSIINIYVFYKIGTLLNNKKTGIILALILAVNHLAISTVSFIKFYCLCFLIFSISLYYIIKILKCDKGYTKLGIANLFFILSSTLGFLVVFTEYLAIFLFKKNKKILNSIFFATIGFSLYLPILLKQIQINANTIISPHSSYSELSPLAFYLFLNDYFTPLLNYCCNLITIESCSYLGRFIKSIYQPPFDTLSFVVFILLSFIPVIASIYALTKGIKDNKTIKKISIIALIYLLIFSLLVILEKTGFIPIYIYPVGIILLIILGFGLSLIKNKKLYFILLTCIILPQLIIPNSYPLEKRGIEDSKIYNGFFKFYSENYSENTYFIATSAGRFLNKYYKEKNILDFDCEKMKGNFKKDFIGLLFGEDVKKTATKENLNVLLKDKLLSKKRNDDFENYFNKEVLNKTKLGDKIVLCLYTDEHPFLLNDLEINAIINKNYRPHLSKATLKSVMSDEQEYDASYLSDIIMRYSYEYLIELLDKNFKRTKIEQYQKTLKDDYIKTFEGNFAQSTLWIAQNAIESWIFITYEKTN